MSKVILTSGFLGSGKTTFIMSLVDYFAQSNIKTALLINEIGEIGIDNKYMKKLGYNIWELYGGCICCTLVSGLAATMEQLKEYNPDVILMEPSGAADPKVTLDALTNMGVERRNIINIFLLDTTRLEMFIVVLLPLMLSSIAEADVVLINKVELAGESAFEEAARIVRESGYNGNVVRAERDNPINEKMRALINGFLSGKGI